MDNAIKLNNTKHANLIISGIRDMMDINEKSGYIITREIVEDILNKIQKIYATE